MPNDQNHRLRSERPIEPARRPPKREFARDFKTTRYERLFIFRAKQTFDLAESDAAPALQAPRELLAAVWPSVEK
jgi:hypothetical protein